MIENINKFLADRQEFIRSKQAGGTHYTNVILKEQDRLTKRALEDSAEIGRGKGVVLLDGKITPAGSKKDEVEARACYPSSEDPEMVGLSCIHLMCLEPKGFLSSPVMDFYISYLQRHLLLAGTQRSCHFFSSYFYEKLEEFFSPEGNKKISFSQLRGWWKGVNIFQKEYIFMPVYGNNHWSLVIICIPPDDDNSGPIVLHLDSLVYHNSIKIFYVINKLLNEEWMCMDHDTPKRQKNLPRKIENKIVKVPQQENDYDCGLFVLNFMEKFYGKAPERLRKKDLSMFGKRWFEKVDASGLRERIKSLLSVEKSLNPNSETNQESVKTEKPNSDSNQDGGKTRNPNPDSNIDFGTGTGFVSSRTRFQKLKAATADVATKDADVASKNDEVATKKAKRRNPIFSVDESAEDENEAKRYEVAAREGPVKRKTEASRKSSDIAGESTKDEGSFMSDSTTKSRKKGKRS